MKKKNQGGSSIPRGRKNDKKKRNREWANERWKNEEEEQNKGSFRNLSRSLGDELLDDSSHLHNPRFSRPALCKGGLLSLATVIFPHTLWNQELIPDIFGSTGETSRFSTGIEPAPTILQHKYAV